MTKIYHFLTALILTVAALATPSASAFMAAFRDGIHWGFAVDATTTMAAEEMAMEECENNAGNSGNCVHRPFSDGFIVSNRCLAVAIQNNNPMGAVQISTTVAIFTISNSNPTFNTARYAIEQANESDDFLNDPTLPDGYGYMLVDLDDRDVCDNTCSGDNVPPLAEDQVGGCRKVRSNADCRTVATRDMHNREYVDTNTNGETICREELLCEEGNRIPNGSGGCTICDDDEMANMPNDECIPIVPTVRLSVSVQISVQVSVSVQVSTMVTVVENEITLTMHTIRTSENIITVTATDGEEFAVTTTSGSAVTITAANGEIFVVNNQGSASGEPGGETPQSGGISTIEHKANNEKTAVIAAGIGLGVGAVALALYYFIDSPDKIIYEPSYAFQNNNGNLSYSLGNRWTATADNWRFYWQAKQNDKFVYGSGIGYNNGLLSAAINSQSEKDKTDLDLQLSANKTVGLWNLGGGVNFDMQLSETETESQNRMNATIRYTMDKWILSANANTDGKKAAARINYSYRF